MMWYFQQANLVQKCSLLVAMGGMTRTFVYPGYRPWQYLITSTPLFTLTDLLQFNGSFSLCCPIVEPVQVFVLSSDNDADSLHPWYELLRLFCFVRGNKSGLLVLSDLQLCPYQKHG